MLHKLKHVRTVLKDLRDLNRCVSDRKSLFQYTKDRIRVAFSPPSEEEHCICMKNGVRISYRMNKGDLQSIREVWVDEAYRLPFDVGSGTLVDLGGNIGLTSLWLAKRYGFKKIVMVEPSPSNALLARKNLADNGVVVEVIEAAVGPTDGVVYFEEHTSSNQGHVSAEGKPVRMVSMNTILSQYLKNTKIDLVKMDIEGGEEALLQGDRKWLESVNALIGEFHPAVIDYPQAVQLISEKGFTYIAAGSSGWENMDSFVCKLGAEQFPIQ